MQHHDRSFAIIGAPSSAGAYAPGQEKAPAAFRRHGLVEQLALRHPTVDLGDVEGFRWRPDLSRPKSMNADHVARVANDVSKRVAGAMAEGRVAIVLGGDCTVELGTVAGASADGASVGLVYIDLDTDLNPPATSDGALDWTGVAHLLDLPGTLPELSALGRRRPMISPEDILFLGADNITPPERRAIDQLQMRSITLAESKHDPSSAGNAAAQWAAKFDRMLVHLDVDVLSFIDFPIAENVRRCDGLTLGELATALGPILASPNWRAITICEVNPDHAPDEAPSFEQLIDALCTAVGWPS